MKFLKRSFVLLALLYAQIECIKADDGDNSGEIVVINTSAIKIIEAVVDITVNFISKGIMWLNSESSDIPRILANAEKVVIDALWDTIVDELNELQEGLSDDKKAAVECIKENGSNLTETALNFTYQIVTCGIQVSIFKANLAMPLLGDIGKTNDQLKSLTKELDKCQDVEDVKVCADKISDEILEEFKNLWTKLQEDIAIARQLSESFDKTAEACQQEASDELEKKITNVISDISQCVEEKTPNSTIIV
ncbi:hypothetical protein NQ315_003171 [Exocentrus adspersus]|uniref:Uncharacterized protein n=1 Tax=Exocentrus adspersus TaxID=1586481 RepID=A0AAV8W6P3_9CUCU|nr:hypothetical protein NQ315_003171 [Exocentrus adspersus]